MAVTDLFACRFCKTFRGGPPRNWAMTVILQSALPAEMRGAHALPGVAPCGPDDWLRVDDAYAAQMAYRIEMLDRIRPKVLWSQPDALPAAREALREVLAILPGLGFTMSPQQVLCPDGRRVDLDWGNPMLTLGHLVQQDICILQKSGDEEEHVLTAAVLCFPANWRLREKVGRPLTAIHVPVAEYDADLARRVQRLFDGVRPGKPLWRFNRLSYVDPDLHQPTRKQQGQQERLIRSERQCIIRLPQTQAVVFAIHTFVVAKE